LISRQKRFVPEEKQALEKLNNHTCKLTGK